MKVLLRVDASASIGTGHVMRCLTLADALRELGADCTFVMAPHAGHLIELARERGFRVESLPGPGPFLHHPGDALAADVRSTLDVAAQLRPDWLIVDHYAIDLRWEQELRPFVRGILVIDDLADRRHDCDLLLDQNFYRNLDARYTGLVPESCSLVLGPSNVLLPPAFVTARQTLRARTGEVRRLLVFFGGSDPAGQTEQVLHALATLQRTDISVDVVAGGDAARLTALRQQAASLPQVRVHGRVPHMAKLIAQADLGIGAGGSSMWERCYLGLPTITVTFADNQVRTTEDVASIGAIAYLGRCSASHALPYATALDELIASQTQRIAFSEASLALVQPGTAGMAGKMHALLAREAAAKRT